MQKLSLKIFIKKMNKENLASMITRLYFCNDTKLENKDEYMRMKNDLLALNERMIFAKNFGNLVFTIKKLLSLRFKSNFNSSY